MLFPRPSLPFPYRSQFGRRIFASLVIALGPALALSADETKPDGASERETIVFEGIRIVFPKGEADVAVALKPALHGYLRKRQPMADEEAEAFANMLSNPDLVKKIGARIGALMARESTSSEFEARCKASAATLRKSADAWRKWSGGISEVQLWSPDELKQFQTREDGEDDAEGMKLHFPQVSFGKNGARFSLHPPLASPLLGLDFMRNVGKEIAPLRLDFPLYYKPGESAEKIAEFDVKFMEQLPAFLRQQVTVKFAEALPLWLIEYLLLGEIETLWIDAPAARDTVLAEALARTLLFAHLLGQQGEKKTAAQISNLFPFAKIDGALPGTEEIISDVEKMDALAVLAPEKVTERVLARNLIALTLIRIAQTEPGGKPIFHKFNEAGITIPAERFNAATFTAAVDKAYGEEGLFRRMLAAQQKETASQLRQSAARQKEQPKPQPAPVATAAPALPNRESAIYDGLTITFPPELKGTMPILGPECAKALAEARAFAEALRKKSPKPAALEVTDEDLAAYRQYGLEVNAEIIRAFAAGLPTLTDSKALLVRFFSGDRIAVWFKEDLIALLKAGKEVPGFTLNLDGESGAWNFKLGVNLDFDGFHRLTLEGKDVGVELEKRLNGLPPIELPMVVKRTDLTGKLDDPEAAAAALRAGDRGILGLLLRGEKEPLKESDLAGFSRPLMSLEQVWFLVAHEAAENALVSGTIASADRRWFCDGMANWIAIREVDRRFGAGKGAEAFAKNYHAEELKDHAGEVNLLAWPAQEDIDNGARPQVGNVAAHYYFATLMIEKACEGQGGDFVKRWLEEIRRTPLNRTNSGTVMTAFQKLTGKNLTAIMASVAPLKAHAETGGGPVPAGTNDVDELHRRGVAKFEKGDLDGALADFTRAIEMMPKNPAGYSNRGHVRVMKGDLEEAVADYNRALELDPKYNAAYGGRANAKSLKGDVKGALADFTRAIENDPNDATAYDGRGGLKYLSGELDGALTDLNRALEIDPKNASALANRSKVRHQKGDLDGEIADYNALLEIHPKDPEVVNNRGAARHLKGDYEGAIADSNRALELDPRYAPAYDLRGVTRRSKGDLAGAIADGDRAIELDPKYVRAYNNRGNARWDTGDNDGAIADFNRAVELNPKDPVAYANRGNPKQAKGDLDGALADYTHAIELDPKYEQAYSNRGAVRYAKGDVKGAIADASRALELDPKSESAWNNRGVFKSAVPDLEGAIADYRHALELNPNYIGAWQNLANARKAKGELDGAIADFSRALELDPKLVAAWHDRGALRMRKGDLEGAIADLGRVVEIDPRNERNLNDRGMLRKAHGEIEGAIADFSRVIELNPKNESAYLGRGAAKSALNDLDGAIADYSHAIALNSKLERAYFDRGVAYYRQQHWQEASADFDADLRQEKPEEYAALMTCVVRTRMGKGEAARKELSAWLEKRGDEKREGWVSKLASFMLGTLDETALIKLAESANQKEAAGWRCEAWYYAGMQRLAAGQGAAAADCFRKCVATKQQTFTEYTLASGELEWLGEK